MEQTPSYDKAPRSEYFKELVIDIESLRRQRESFLIVKEDAFTANSRVSKC